jgi:hypothetical protein
MNRETLTNRVRMTTRSLRRLRSARSGQKHKWQPAYEDKVVTWVAGYKFTLHAEDWMRGH